MLSGGAPTLTGTSLFLEISAHKFECEANKSGHVGVGHVWIGQLWLSELLAILGEYAQKQNFRRLIIMAKGFCSFNLLVHSTDCLQYWHMKEGSGDLGPLHVNA